MFRVSGQWIRLQDKAFQRVFGIAPRGVRTDVISFPALCSQHGLRTGSCLTVGEELLHSSGYAESWSCFIDNKPAVLYIEPPPPVTSLRQEQRRAMALFCLATTLQQMTKGRHCVLVHPENSTFFWNLPTTKTLENSPRVSWGRVSMCSNWTLTSNFVRGQLEPLLCSHHTTKQKKTVTLATTSWDLLL
jgi:hypothetical protein